MWERKDLQILWSEGSQDLGTEEFPVPLRSSHVGAAYVRSLPGVRAACLLVWTF